MNGQPGWLPYIIMRFLVFSFLVVASVGGAEKVVVPWSFKALKRPALPQVEGSAVELDRFIIDRLQREGAALNPMAERATLIRRVTLDLHGLLPTPQEVAAFVEAPLPDEAAFEAVVDGLLKSPRFGERWGRHWLDVVRYADSVGRSWNAPFIAAARYRDWVIDAFNSDMPYTQFVAAQVAGDLMPAKAGATNVVGTGMLALGSLDLTALQYDQFRLDRIDDQIDVTTRAFMGLTIACARCHDHKKDPVTQADYYALAGLFESSQTWSGTAHKAEHRGNLYVEPEYLLRINGGSKTTADAPLARGSINAMDDAPAMMSEEVVQPRNGNEPIRYGFDPGLVMAVTDDKPANCAIRVAGDPYQEGQTIRRGELAIPGLPPMPKVGPQESGRLQLAQWLTTPTHPLTSRVMVNRVWSHLFGQGIVRTVDDFGITGEKPDHPELLDHLAVKFVEGGWSVKSLIKMLVVSRTYRQSSVRVEGSAVARELLAGMPLRRVEMEVLRDVLLQVSGQLSLERPVGVPLAGTGGKGNSGRTRGLIGVESPYRTVYLPVLRDLLTPMHEVWDFPNPTQIKGQREVTTVPAQGLFMLNNAFVMEAAERFAEQLQESGTSEDARLTKLYEVLLCRQPEAEELKDAKELLGELGGGGEGLAGLVQAVMGGVEFRYRN
jgi:cytochrome c553